MTDINVQNIEQNADLFVYKMGFAHDCDGLDMTDDQLVNFLLLCQQVHHLPHTDFDELRGVAMRDHVDDDDDMPDIDEMMDMPHGKDVKVKVMKLNGGNVQNMMDELLGG